MTATQAKKDYSDVDFTDPIGDGTTVWGWDAEPGTNANQRQSGFGFYQNQPELTRDQYNADLSWFVGNFGGSHEFKIGYEYEEIGVKNDNWNGGTGQRNQPAGHSEHDPAMECRNRSKGKPEFDEQRNGEQRTCM